jgi:hypothetical protein
VAVKDLFGFFNSLRVVVAKQRLEAGKVPVASKSINAIFRHNRSASGLTFQLPLHPLPAWAGLLDCFLHSGFGPAGFLCCVSDLVILSPSYASANLLAAATGLPHLRHCTLSIESKLWRNVPEALEFLARR